MYGAIKEGSSKPQFSMAMSLGDIAACLIVPLLIFTVVSYASESFIHYSLNWLHWAICIAALMIALVFGYMAFTSRKLSVGVVFALSLLGWILGVALGNGNYNDHTVPYYDILNLNVYKTVDPSKFTGQQLMDAGQIEFVPGTHMNLSKSYGFKNEDVYCVAPIVGPNAGKEGPEVYDFWAVGLNCCSGHAADFRCGEYNNVNARKGLRLMRDYERNFFRLAVQEAEAAYNIRANFPVFMYWMEHPSDEIDAYQDDASKTFFMGVGIFAIVEVLITVLVVVAFNR